jgi:hypothetical protein
VAGPPPSDEEVPLKWRLVARSSTPTDGDRPRSPLWACAARPARSCTNPPMGRSRRHPARNDVLQRRFFDTHVRSLGLRDPQPRALLLQASPPTSRSSSTTQPAVEDRAPYIAAAKQALPRIAFLRDRRPRRPPPQRAARGAAMIPVPGVNVQALARPTAEASTRSGSTPRDNGAFLVARESA